jgi:hypothetical protein
METNQQLNPSIDDKQLWHWLEEREEKRGLGWFEEATKGKRERLNLFVCLFVGLAYYQGKDKCSSLRDLGP